MVSDVETAQVVVRHGGDEWQQQVPEQRRLGDALDASEPEVERLAWLRAQHAAARFQHLLNQLKEQRVLLRVYRC